jgi:hypothetical protein
LRGQPYPVLPEQQFVQRLPFADFDMTEHPPEMILWLMVYFSDNRKVEPFLETSRLDRWSSSP